MMKDVFWQYFQCTGNVDAYLLYKDKEDGFPLDSMDDGYEEQADKLPQAETFQ